MFKFFILFFIGIFASINAIAATWYVNDNAVGANNGNSWVDAFSDLQNAISASNYGDEIWVAAGTYKPTPTNTRSISFLIKNGTKIYGGFQGTETLESQRNSELNTTVLSGEIGAGATNDNTYSVVYFSNVGIQTEIDGFTILAGYNSSSSGAGVRSANSSPIIGNCKIVGNYSDIGGGLSHGGSGNISIHHCVFEGNISATQGGAINIFVGTNNVIANCYFKSNQSSGIGGIICMASSSSAALTVSNSIMSNNTSNSSGIYFNSSSLINLYNCLIVGNYSTTTGIIRTETSSSTKSNKIVNCTIAHNGQGISTGTANTSVALNSQSSIVNSIIYGNNSLSQVLGTGLSMTNCIMQTGVNSASGTNVLGNNPNFLSPGSFISAPFDASGYNYQLKAISPAINFGLNSSAVGALDLDGNLRIQNSMVDLGAYESNYCVSSLTFSPPTPHAICGGAPISLSVTGGVDFLWSNGSVNSSVNISTPGTYSVAFEDTLGCRGFLTTGVMSVPNPAPVIVFTGGNLNVGSFANYQWSYNGAPIIGAIMSSHVPFEGHGVYSVVVINSNGCSGSDSFCFSPAAINATGPTTFCLGGSVTLTVTGGTGFVWSNNELDSSITVTTSGTYSVIVQNTTVGCATILQQVVSVVSPPLPVIALIGGVLTTGSFASYQWNFNGNPLPNSTSPQLAPSNGNGQYTVTVTNSLGCVGISSVYNYSNVGLIEISSPTVLIYPNPLNKNELLKLSSDEEIFEYLTITVHDLKGSECFKINSTGLPSFIELTHLKPGIYFISIETEEKFLKKMKISVQ